jgi:hypothetical protein
LRKTHSGQEELRKEQGVRSKGFKNKAMPSAQGIEGFFNPLNP